jgi:hypothetical protein
MSLRALAILGVGLAVGGGLDAQQQVFRTGTDVVLVDVLVTRDRRAVTDLQVHDFEVLDNGVRQTVEIVESGHLMPIDLTLLTDVSASIADPVLQRMRTAIPRTSSCWVPMTVFRFCDSPAWFERRRSKRSICHASPKVTVRHSGRPSRWP